MISTYLIQAAKHSKTLVDSDGGWIKTAMTRWELNNARSLLPENMDSFFKSLHNYESLHYPNEDSEELVLSKHFFLTGEFEIKF